MDKIYKIVAKVEGQDKIATLGKEVAELKKQIVGASSEAQKLKFAQDLATKTGQMNALNKAFGDTGKGVARYGQAMQAAGYAVQDFVSASGSLGQKLNAILNNLPGILGNLGLGGLGTALTIVSTAAIALYNNWDTLMKVFGNGKIKTETEEMKELEKATDRTGRQAYRLWELKRKLAQQEKDAKQGEAVVFEGGELQKKGGEEARKAVAEQGDPFTGKTGGQNLRDLLEMATIQHPSGRVDKRTMDQIAKIQKEHDEALAASVNPQDREAANKKFTDQMTKLEKSADYQNQIDALLGQALSGNETAIQKVLNSLVEMRDQAADMVEQASKAGDQAGAEQWQGRVEGVDALIQAVGKGLPGAVMAKAKKDAGEKLEQSAAEHEEVVNPEELDQFRKRLEAIQPTNQGLKELEDLEKDWTKSIGKARVAQKKINDEFDAATQALDESVEDMKAQDQKRKERLRKARERSEKIVPDEEIDRFFENRSQEAEDRLAARRPRKDKAFRAQDIRAEREAAIGLAKVQATTEVQDRLLEDAKAKGKKLSPEEARKIAEERVEQQARDFQEKQKKALIQGKGLREEDPTTANKTRQELMKRFMQGQSPEGAIQATAKMLEKELATLHPEMTDEERKSAARNTAEFESKGMAADLLENLSKSEKELKKPEITGIAEYGRKLQQSAGGDLQKDQLDVQRKILEAIKEGNHGQGQGGVWR